MSLPQTDGHLANGTPRLPSDYEPTNWQEWQPRPRWHDRGSRFVHSVKWVDRDGLEHLPQRLPRSAAADSRAPLLAVRRQKGV